MFSGDFLFNATINVKEVLTKSFLKYHLLVKKCHFFLTVGRSRGSILECCDILFSLESYQPQVTAQVGMVGAGDQLMMSYEIFAG